LHRAPSYLYLLYTVLSTYCLSTLSSSVVIYYCFFFLLLRQQPRSTLFPYTTLFRSHAHVGDDGIHRLALEERQRRLAVGGGDHLDRKSTRLNSSHGSISYAVFCLKKKKTTKNLHQIDPELRDSSQTLTLT